MLYFAYATLIAKTLAAHYLLTNPDARHPKLDKIIEIAPKGLVIVIQNMRELGNVSQIKEYYNIFKEKDIYILCFDHLRLSGLSEYSTSDFGFGQRNKVARQP